MRITVLGGGNAAHALAGDLGLAGFDVALAEVPELSGNIAAARSLGGIQVTGTPPLGGAPGFAKVEATTDVAAAVGQADLIWLAVPAYAHDAFFQHMVPAVREGQVIVIMPGKFGAMALQARLSAQRPGLQVVIGETESFIYATRLRGPSSPWIKSAKSTMRLAALPARRTPAALGAVQEIFGQRFVAASSVLETSFSQPGIIMHPMTTLLNASRIEQMGPYKNAYYDVTPGVARAMAAVDEERTRVGAALGVHGTGLVETLGRFYGIDPSQDVYDAIRSVKSYGTQTAPDSLQHRYVHEDVPFGLVPISELGRLVGVPTPGMDAVIHLAGMMNGTDYWREGRTLQKMGLERFAGQASDLVKFVTG